LHQLQHRIATIKEVGDKIHQLRSPAAQLQVLVILDSPVEQVILDQVGVHLVIIIIIQEAPGATVALVALTGATRTQASVVVPDHPEVLLAEALQLVEVALQAVVVAVVGAEEEATNHNNALGNE
jgi:hypothetical protein